jgi:hypothetical protein
LDPASATANRNLIPVLCARRAVDTERRPRAAAEARRPGARLPEYVRPPSASGGAKRVIVAPAALQDTDAGGHVYLASRKKKTHNPW